MSEKRMGTDKNGENGERFTPGPWYIRPREVIRHQRYGDAYTRTTILDKPDGQYSPRHVIATVARGNGREEANAALIAAAPEMQEALSEAVERYGKPGGPWNVPSEPGSWIMKAKAALAKARGEE